MVHEEAVYSPDTINVIMAEQRDALCDALRRLANEVLGLVAFEKEIRAVIGNTNYNLLLLRAAEAKDLL